MRFRKWLGRLKFEAVFPMQPPVDKIQGGGWLPERPNLAILMAQYTESIHQGRNEHGANDPWTANRGAAEDAGPFSGRTGGKAGGISASNFEMGMAGFLAAFSPQPDSNPLMSNAIAQSIHKIRFFIANNSRF